MCDSIHPASRRCEWGVQGTTSVMSTRDSTRPRCRKRNPFCRSRNHHSHITTPTRPMRSKPPLLQHTPASSGHAWRLCVLAHDRQSVLGLTIATSWNTRCCPSCKQLTISGNPVAVFLAPSKDATMTLPMSVFRRAVRSSILSLYINLPPYQHLG
jgi:hypothetical protein